MPINYINTGSGANAGDGDSLRSAFIKVNDNFTEILNIVNNGNGYTGSAGAGYTGSRGIQGPFGPQGFTGSAGAGYTGSSGIMITITTTTSFEGVQGQIWFNQIDGRAYIRDNNTWLDLSPTLTPDPATYLDGLTISGTTITPVDSTATVSIESNGNTWIFKNDGATSFPNYTFPYAAGSAGQVLVDVDGNGILSWQDQTGTGGGSTRWDAVPLEAGCPIYTELTPDHFYAYTQRSHLVLENNGYWDLGSVRFGNGIQGYFDGNINVYSTGTINLRSGYSSNEWSFSSTGTLTLPNGASIGSDNSLLGIPLTTERGTILFGNQPELVPCTGPSHFHIMKANEDATDLFFGDDFNYVKLPGNDGGYDHDYGVEIGTDGSNTWRFGTDGLLTIPGDIQDANGSVIRVATTSTAPTRDNGQLWFNTVDGRGYIRYNDTWIDLNPTEVPSPSTYLDGLTIDGTTISTVDTTATTIYLEGDLIPTMNNTYDLGSPEYQWKSLYVSTGTIYIGGTPLSVDPSGNLTVAGSPVSGALPSDQGLVTFPGNFLIGTLWPTDPGGDKESVVWAKDDSEYLGLWWGGDQIYPESNYGPVAGIQIGTGNTDDFTDSPSPIDTTITLAINGDSGTLEWVFGRDGSLTLPSGAGFAKGDSGVLKVNDGTTQSLDIRDVTGAGFYTDSPGYVLRSNGSNNWVFGRDGNLSIPASGDITRNGSSVLFSKNLADLNDVSVGGVANGQVLTYLTAIGKWVPTTGTAGGAGTTGYYASFYSTGTYNVTTSSVTNVIINGTFESNGISRDANGYQITFLNSGTYLLNYAIQVKNTDTQNRDIDIWFRVNDIDVPNSNTKFTIPAAALDGDPGKLLAVSPLTLTASTSDKISIACIAESDTISIFEQAASVSPAIPYTPSAILTVGLVFYKGEIGPQGDIGYTGSRGNTGDTGYIGSVGYTGSAGTQGNIGYTGSAGYVGSASTIPGYTGSAGTGYTGSAGLIGYTGSAGSFNGTSINTTATFISTLTTAVSTNTGILQVQGGLGVSGNLYANTVYSGDGYLRGPSGYGNIFLATGGALYVSGDLVLNGTGLIKGPAGYINITLNSGWNTAVRFASTATVASTSNATTSTNGALIVSGGAGVAKDLYVGGVVSQPALPAFRVYGNGAVISALTTLTNAHWVMDYNQGNYLTTSTGYFTAPVAGIYQINLVMRTNSNSSSTIGQAIVIKTVGSTATNIAMLEFGANTTMNHAGVSTAAKLAVGDTLKVVVAVGTLNFDANDNWSVAFLG